MTFSTTLATLLAIILACKGLSLYFPLIAALKTAVCIRNESQSTTRPLRFITTLLSNFASISSPLYAVSGVLNAKEFFEIIFWLIS